MHDPVSLCVCMKLLEDRKGYQTSCDFVSYHMGAGNCTQLQCKREKKKLQKVQKAEEQNKTKKPLKSTTSIKQKQKHKQKPTKQSKLLQRVSRTAWLFAEKRWPCWDGSVSSEKGLEKRKRMLKSKFLQRIKCVSGCLCFPLGSQAVWVWTRMWAETVLSSYQLQKTAWVGGSSVSPVVRKAAGLLVFQICSWAPGEPTDPPPPLTFCFCFI